MKNIFYCFVALSLLLSACSDDLSRGKAEEMIKAKMEKNKSFPLYATFVWNDFGGFYNHNLSHLSLTQIDQLGYEGYTLRDKTKYGLFQSFTEKAKPFGTVIRKNNFITGQEDYFYLQLATVDKLVVNSMDCGKKIEDSYGRPTRQCVAKYEIKFKPNVIGEKLQIGDNYLTKTDSAYFFFEDNVWRIIGGVL